MFPFNYHPDFFSRVVISNKTKNTYRTLLVHEINIILSTHWEKINLNIDIWILYMMPFNDAGSIHIDETILFMKINHENVLINVMSSSMSQFHLWFPYWNRHFQSVSTYLFVRFSLLSSASMVLFMTNIAVLAFQWIFFQTRFGSLLNPCHKFHICVWFDWKREWIKQEEKWDFCFLFSKYFSISFFSSCFPIAVRIQKRTCMNLNCTQFLARHWELMLIILSELGHNREYDWGPNFIDFSNSWQLNTSIE